MIASLKYPLKILNHRLLPPEQMSSQVLLLPPTLKNQLEDPAKFLDLTKPLDPNKDKYSLVFTNSLIKKRDSLP
jgi:hypothetical protein